MGQSLLHRGSCITKKTALLQSGTYITNWDSRYYKVGQVIHYNVGQSLLQSMVSIIKWGNFIAKWDNYNRKGQYIFVTLEEIETHVYWQCKCTLRMAFYMIGQPSDSSKSFRKIHIFARAHTIYEAFDLTGVSLLFQQLQEVV